MSSTMQKHESQQHTCRTTQRVKSCHYTIMEIKCWYEVSLNINCRANVRGRPVYDESNEFRSFEWMYMVDLFHPFLDSRFNADQWLQIGLLTVHNTCRWQLWPIVKWDQYYSINLRATPIISSAKGKFWSATHTMGARWTWIAGFKDIQGEIPWKEEYKRMRPSTPIAISYYLESQDFHV